MMHTQVVCHQIDFLGRILNQGSKESDETVRINTAFDHLEGHFTAWRNRRDHGQRRPAGRDGPYRGFGLEAHIRAPNGHPP